MFVVARTSPIVRDETRTATRARSGRACILRKSPTKKNGGSSVACTRRKKHKRSDHHFFVCLQGNDKKTAEPRLLQLRRKRNLAAGATLGLVPFSPQLERARVPLTEGASVNKRASARGVSFYVFLRRVVYSSAQPAGVRIGTLPPAVWSRV